MRILSLFSLSFSFISLNLDSKRLFHCHEIKKLRVDKFHQLCLIYCSSFSMRSSTDIPARWIKSQWDAKNQLTENTFSSIKRSGTSAESNYSASFSIRLKFPWSRAKVKTVCVRCDFGLLLQQSQQSFMGGLTQSECFVCSISQLCLFLWS